jgi:peptide/nickel transport system substrate-binding protein
MRRRDFIKATSAMAAGALAAPSLALAQNNRVLRFVPQANLANLDPIWGTQYVVRNASLLIWDTLYGTDENLEPKPQMVESHEATDGAKTWTFKLRAGLKFHDGEPVRAKDVVASLNRWMKRDAMGILIASQMDALEAADDRTFRFRLNKPFPKMLFALAKGSTPMAFIMPERIAQTDPFKQIDTVIGSGPMRFLKDEFVPGSRAAFARFDGYVPREDKPSWLAGAKRIHFDRVEWHILPDPATASAALQNGEVDWWETPFPDIIPLLKRNRQIAVDVADPLGNIGSFRINHLHPPFNDVRARRAIQMALSQADYMRAVAGDDEAMWKPVPSFFTPGTPLYTEAGGEPLKGPRNIEGAKKLLAEAGYRGEPITVLVGTDIAVLNAQGQVTADLLKRLGMTVDYVATDWGTVGQRRAKKDPPAQGGWHIFHTWHAGADCVNPAANIAINSGPGAWFGWPRNDTVQAKIAEWYAAPDIAAEKAAIAELNAAAMADVTYVPTGFFLMNQAWRRDLSGVVKAPYPVLWDVKKG